MNSDEPQSSTYSPSTGRQVSSSPSGNESPDDRSLPVPVAESSAVDSGPGANTERGASTTGQERPERNADSDSGAGAKSSQGGDHPSSKAQPSGDAKQSGDAERETATIIVKGEAVREDASKSASKEKDGSKDKDGPKDKDGSKDKEGSKDKDKARKEPSPAKVKLQQALPKLDDDADVGVQKLQTVVRDGKADLTFTGTLVASAAPASAPKGKWQEYRVYETDGGKHVFSKVKRSIFVEDEDGHEAEVFDPHPQSMPSQLLRSARDLTRSKPLTWADAAVEFFGYDALAKTLYRKLDGGQFEERIG